MAKYVLDTNAIIDDPTVLERLDDVSIPYVVLEELDKLKTRNELLGQKVRTAIKLINSKNIEIVDVPENSLVENNDDMIIASAKKEKAILCTNDIAASVKAKSRGVEVCSVDDIYKNKRERNEIYAGSTTIEVDDDIIDGFYTNHFVNLDNEECELNPNEYVVLRSTYSRNKTCIGRHDKDGRIVPLIVKENAEIFGKIKARNLEQLFALDALLNPNIPVVSLIGKAGCGKTLLAAAAGVQQVFGKSGSEKLYTRMIISRPIQPMGNDIGFLPGTMEEKLAPWIQPIIDNLEVISGGDKTKIESWFEKDKIQIEAPTYIRGRSINNAFIILDESQNLSKHEIKTILTRLGEGSKIVLTGDVEQIDNPKLDKLSNGMVYAIEQLKEYDLTSHITMKKSERSKVADLCARVL